MYRIVLALLLAALLTPAADARGRSKSTRIYNATIHAYGETKGAVGNAFVDEMHILHTGHQGPHRA